MNQREQVEARWIGQLEADGRELAPCPRPRVRRELVAYVPAPAGRTARVSHRRTYAITAGVTTGLGVLAGLVWLVAVVVAWIVAHLAAIIGGAVVVLVLLALLVGSGKCPGLHCPGCGG